MAQKRKSLEQVVVFFKFSQQHSSTRIDVITPRVMYEGVDLRGKKTQSVTAWAIQAVKDYMQHRKLAGIHPKDIVVERTFGFPGIAARYLKKVTRSNVDAEPVILAIENYEVSPDTRAL